ncbi:MAG: hypothetical protein FP814_14585 [Desulfobacterium sp.]|nr:hypothetical protein [Desulfobacterium sp.]
MFYSVNFNRFKWFQKATAKNLRFHINTVNRGEEVIINFRGKSLDKLIPYTEEPVSKRPILADLCVG